MTGVLILLAFACFGLDCTALTCLWSSHKSRLHATAVRFCSCIFWYCMCCTISIAQYHFCPFTLPFSYSTFGASIHKNSNHCSILISVSNSFCKKPFIADTYQRNAHLLDSVRIWAPVPQIHLPENLQLQPPLVSKLLTVINN